MHLDSETPKRELFLVLRGIKGQVESLLGRLRAFSDPPEAALLLGVDLLYRPDRDLALLRLYFGARLSRSQRQTLIRLAEGSGVPVLDPLRLSSRDKDIFYERHLKRYTIRVDDQKNPHSALNELRHLLATMKQENEETTVVDVAEWLGVPEKKPLRSANAQPTELLRIGTVAVASFDALDLGPAGKTKAKGHPKKPPTARTSGTTARRTHARLATVRERPCTNSLAAGEPPHEARVICPTSNASEVSATFERGERWLPARLRGVSRSEVRLAASAAPPLGTNLRVTLTLGELSVTLRGMIKEVINTEMSTDGSTSFRLQIDENNPSQALKLSALLLKAKDKGIELSAPPPRKNRRFAVTWRIAIISNGHRFDATARDVSRQGLFVATRAKLQSKSVDFELPLDSKGTLIRGRARVARHVSLEMACDQHLVCGYGLHFEPLAAEYVQLYENFLRSVQQRSQLHVLVTGDSKRSSALVESFEGAGYTVSQARSARHLKEHRSLKAQRPHIAVIDERCLPRDSRARFEERFESHEVPMLHLQGAAPAAARLALDRALAV